MEMDKYCLREYSPRMKNDRRPLTDIEKRECSALKAEIAALNGGLPREKRWTQDALAHDLGMSQGTLSSHLNGHRAISRDMALKVARLLGIRIEAFSPRLAKELAEMTKGLAVEPAQTEAPRSAADLVHEMLAKSGKNLSETARQRLLAAAEEQANAAPAPITGNVITADFSRPGLVGDEIRIPHYDVRAAMGGGQIPADYVELLRDVSVSQEHLRRLGVDFESPYHLKIITGWGQSMAPTIQDKDPLLIDVRIDEYTGDGIYLFTEGDMLFIKRLQLESDGQLKVISDNRNHDARYVTPGQIYVKGRVLLIWNAQRA